MARWSPIPKAGQFSHTPAAVRRLWRRLHAGDAEPLPRSEGLLQAWTLLHNGRFQDAAAAGLELGVDGWVVANAATCLHANYLEKKEHARLELFTAVAERAAQQAAQSPDLPSAWYWQAYALGRYSQGISVAKALAQGLGTRVRDALEKTIALEPRHADAHLALAAFHAEVIDKVGALIGGLTYGARKEAGLRLYDRALALNPESPGALVEYANGLMMLEGRSHEAQAAALYERAAAIEPLDAPQWLDVEMAREGLRD